MGDTRIACTGRNSHKVPRLRHSYVCPESIQNPGLTRKARTTATDSQADVDTQQDDSAAIRSIAIPAIICLVAVAAISTIIVSVEAVVAIVSLLEAMVTVATNVSLLVAIPDVASIVSLLVSIVAVPPIVRLLVVANGSV